MAAPNHDHNFLKNDALVIRNEKRTLWVVILTAIMMGVEIVAGNLTQSMALLADGWHMASHALALFISYLAYRLARSEKISTRFNFGTGKFIPLGGYTSSIILALIAIFMISESIKRLLAPQTIKFDEAIIVALVGLAVNFVCAMILAGKPHSHLDHDHSHGHERQDHNMRGAYLHVVADAMTSVLAIVALVVGKYFQILWVDALMGIVGSVVILKWAYGLCRETAWELMDGQAKTIDRGQVLALIQDENTRVSDLHVWRVAPRAHACEVVVHVKHQRGADYYRHKLQGRFDISHIIVEEIAELVL